MSRRLIGIALLPLLLGGASVARAHVGSPDTWFEGSAGPYPIRVVVRAPNVVPGLAEIDVRDLSGTARRVTVQPFAWNAGSNGAPPPDVARPVPGDPRLRSVNLWFMITGSYAVHVTVGGDRGEGTAIVPVQAVATRRLPMDPKLGGILIGLGLFLFAGFVTLVGAGVRDAPLPPGERPDHRRVLRARLAMAVVTVALSLALWGGRSWWNGVDRAHAARIYRPFHSTATIVDSAGAAFLTLAIDDERWRGQAWTPLVADHGKLMHLFLLRDADLGAIAHLHPVPSDSSHFTSRLPPLPAGRYRVYADVVHESGFAQTMTTSVEIPPRVVEEAPTDRRAAASANTRAAAGSPQGGYAASDHDDAWFEGSAVAARSEARFDLGDGATLVWERGERPIVEREEFPLRFHVASVDGSPVTLEPYLGMAAHAVVASEDTSVFAHLHPIGTVSMASQMALVMRTPADSIPGTLGRRMSHGDSMTGHSMPAMAPSASRFTIPYGFPRSGRYRIWVQVKIRGTVRTAAFAADVRSAARS